LFANKKIKEKDARCLVFKVQAANGATGSGTKQAAQLQGT